MRNSMIREGGFLPILVIMMIVAVSAVSGATFYYIKEKPGQKSISNEPTNHSPSPYPSPSPSPSADFVSPEADSVLPTAEHESNSTAQSTKGPARSQLSMPSTGPKVQVKPSDSSSSKSLSQQFATIEREILEGKAKGLLFSPNHSDRILNDLDNLEDKSYPKSELDRLRQTVIELSPHLRDQAIQSTSPVTSSVSTAPTMPPPSQTPSCLKTNPTLVADITDFTKIQKITAPGSDSSEGPKGHSFIWTNSQKVPVYAPITGVLESGAYSKDNESSPAQYLLVFKVKGYCDFQFKFDHVDEPVDVIRSALPSVPKVADSRGIFITQTIEFKAGDLIGYTKGNIPSGNWDFGLYNMAEKGALKDSYGMHSYAVCWVDFYSPAKQQQYRALFEGPKLVCSF